MKKEVTRTVMLKGIRPIMFDRYAGDNKIVLMPEQKMHFNTDGKSLMIPSANIHSFLCAENTKSAVKMFYDERAYKKVASAILGFVIIEPMSVPLTRNGKVIQFKGFDENGIYLHKSVARLPKGIPNPKERPLIDTPWEIKFNLTLFPNDTITEIELKNLFEKGGLAIGLGTYRGVYGKFIVLCWK